MFFIRIEPPDILKEFVECYWVVEANEVHPVQQKIIPDGFPEIIFHYGDTYRINIHGSWEMQHKELIGGQLSRHFFLENTGVSGMLGIKLKPSAITQLFSIEGHMLKDKVIPIEQSGSKSLIGLSHLLHGMTDYAQIKIAADEYLIKLLPAISKNDAINKAIQIIVESKGKATVNELCSKLFLSERQLQRLFKKYVGLSPKFYSRLIRFNYIFKLLEEKNSSWLDITYHSGYFDQSHFIRDFKAFSGEDPSKYFFDEKNLANFFLKKTI